VNDRKNEAGSSPLPPPVRQAKPSPKSSSKLHRKVLRGPVEMPDYSKSYYTVDFRDSDGYVLEVAHTPHMNF